MREFAAQIASVFLIAFFLTETACIPFAQASYYNYGADAGENTVSVSFADATGGGFACQLDDALSNPLDRERWWDNTLLRDFSEINSLDKDALMNPDRQIGEIPPITQIVQELPPGWEAVKISIPELARFAEKTPSEVARDLGKKETEEVSVVAAQSYLNNKGKTSNVPAFLQSIYEKFGIKTTEAPIEQPPYCSLKINIPGGKQMPLCELMNYLDVQPECAMEKLVVDGKVSYAGVINQDLFVAYTRAPKLPDPEKRETQQYLSGTKATVALNLNGGGSVVIPKHFMDFVSVVKKVLEVDTILSVGEAIYGFMNLKAMERQVKSQDEVADMYTKFEVRDFPAFETIRANPETRGVYDLIKTTQPELNDLQNLRNTLDGLVTAGRADLVPAREAVNDIITKASNIADPEKQISFIRNEVQAKSGDLMTSVGFNEGMTLEARRSIIRESVDKKRLELWEDPGMITEKELFPWRKASEILGQKAWVNFIFGITWLGPGRLALALADNLVLNTLGKALPDSYVRIYANTDQAAAKFRRATNWVMSGHIFDLVSEYTKTGIPASIWEVGNLYMLNQPIAGSGGGITLIQGGTGGWNLTTDWSGTSDAVFFEDLRPNQEWARMHFFANNVSWGANLQRKKELSTYYDLITAVGVPLLAWRIFHYPDAPIVLLGRLMAMDLYLDYVIDPAKMKQDEICSDEKTTSYLRWYEAMTVLSQAQNLLLFPAPSTWVKTKALNALVKISKNAKFAGKTVAFADKIVGMMNLIAPFDWAKMYAAGEGMEYTMSCKDQAYTVLAYQHEEKGKATAASALTQKLQPAQDLASKLNIGSLLKGITGKVSEKELTEILNLKSMLTNQFGQVFPASMNYLFFQDAVLARSGWFKLMDKNNECFKNLFNLEGENSAIRFSAKDGITALDKKTGQEVKLADALRAILAQVSQALGRTIVPNKLVTADMEALGCDAKKIFEVDLSKRMTIEDECVGKCIKPKLKELTGREVGNDLSSVMGGVSLILTDQGSVSIKDGLVRFIRGTPVGDKLAGTEEQTPSIEAEEKYGSKLGDNLFKASAVEIYANGTVLVKGYVSGEEKVGATDVGVLDTVFFEGGRGAIGFDPVKKQLTIALYILSKTSLQDAQAMRTNNIFMKDELGNQVPSINLHFVPTVGREQQVEELNNALKKIQTDKATGQEAGMRSFETAGKEYFFDTNAQGQPVLKVYDRKTGQLTEYPLTGAPTQTGPNEWTFPTEKGDVKMNFEMDKGVPNINVEAPDFKDSGALTAARGASGGLYFDPKYANVFNAQDIPMNPEFLKGLSMFGSADGNKGIAQGNILAPPVKETTAAGTNLPLALPSWPEQNALGLLMVSLILIGVGVARLRFRKH